MIRRLPAFAVAAAEILASASAHAQSAATDLTSQQLTSITSGKTWAIAFYGDLSDPLRTSYWDFKSDGSVCARLANNKPATKCADTGTWTLQGDSLCWKLQWLGATDGFKEACGRARPVGQAYHLINDRNGGTLMAFRPLK